VGLLDRLFSKKPSQEQFAEMIIEALKKGGATGLKYNAGEFSIRIESRNATFYLDNAYRDYCSRQTKEERTAGVGRYIAAFLDQFQVPEDLESAKPRLMPVVRDPAYFSLIRLKVRSEGGDASKLDYVTKTLAPGLVATVAYDSEHTIFNVNVPTLEKWQMDFDEGVKIATQHLRDRSDVKGFKQIIPGLYVSQFGDSYDSARVLLPDLLHCLNLNGDPVVFLPNRDQLWVTGVYDSAGIGAILKYGAESHFQQGHNLSPNLYLISNGALSLLLPEDAAQREKALSMKRQRQAMDYGQQAGYLKTLLTRQKMDVFVASCTMFKRKDESTFSMCVWSKGVDSLLPETEGISFQVNEAGKNLLVGWEAARRIVSELMEPFEDLWPIRYRVRAFPNEAQLAQLRQLAGTM
jgi:hypothetical protein